MLVKWRALPNDSALGFLVRGPYGIVAATYHQRELVVSAGPFTKPERFDLAASCLPYLRLAAKMGGDCGSARANYELLAQLLNLSVFVIWSSRSAQR
jgi:hypothetical protein